MQRAMKLLGVRVKAADMHAQAFHVLAVPRHFFRVLLQTRVFGAKRRLFRHERLVLGAKLLPGLH
jgi:hypothetical protein